MTNVVQFVSARAPCGLLAGGRAICNDIFRTMGQQHEHTEANTRKIPSVAGLWSLRVLCAGATREPGAQSAVLRLGLKGSILVHARVA